MTVLSVRGLTRRYGGVTAVDGVSFAVAAGEVLGLLGPNGAGKTSMVDAILGLARADAGTVTICGHAAGSRPARGCTGAVLQATGLPDKITPREAVAIFARLQGARPDADALLARFGLTDKAGAAHDTLSGGQKQRLALALAFIGDPKLLVLDEPTTGLDVAARRQLHDDIRAARNEGRAVLLTTHDMAEARALCDRVAVLGQGRILAEGAPAALALEDLIAGAG